MCGANQQVYGRDSEGGFAFNLYHQILLPNVDIFFNPEADTQEVKTAVKDFLDKMRDDRYV